MKIRYNVFTSGPEMTFIQWCATKSELKAFVKGKDVRVVAECFTPAGSRGMGYQHSHEIDTKTLKVIRDIP